eukprot:435411-Amorphochlora_amoeboformis.AAC.1
MPSFIANIHLSFSARESARNSKTQPPESFIENLLELCFLSLSTFKTDSTACRGISPIGLEHVWRITNDEN